MKKLFCAALLCLLCLSVVVQAASLEPEDVESIYQWSEGSHVYIAQKGGVFKYVYVVDENYNILGGPYERIENFSGYPKAIGLSGQQTLFSPDGRIITQVTSKGYIAKAHNGIFAASKDASKIGDITAYEIYDLETGEHLFTADRFFYYYLDGRADCMFIEKDGKYAVIDKYGNFRTDYIYDKVEKRFNPDYYPYPHSYAIVVQDGVRKYIDADLQEIDFADWHGERFVTDMYPISNLNRQGNMENVYRVESGKDWQAIYSTATNSFIRPFEQGIEYTAIGDKYIFAIKGGRAGAMDYDGNLILPFECGGLIEKETNFWYYYVLSGVGGFYDVEKQRFTQVSRNTWIADGLFAEWKYDNPRDTFYKNGSVDFYNAAGRKLIDTQKGTVYEYRGNGEIQLYDKKIQIPLDFAVIYMQDAFLPYDGKVVQDRTMVPMREIVEHLGGTVDWDANTMTATAHIRGKTVRMTVDSTQMFIDDQAVALDVPAMLINDKTMLPVRALAEAVDFTVDWDERLRCVYIE